ncbi:MAG: threonylcarbamoyl-AMP synthase [Chloroflexi bacterium]|nr:threonylcarbamoyl-AMP synthase [Chloroflexota bacterium]
MVPATPANITRAAKILRDGGLVAFPTETVYGLGAHALDPVAVRTIFAAKQRPAWDPLIVHVTGIEMARRLADHLPPRFHELATAFWPGPLTLIVPRAPHVPDEVTAGRPTIALRQPRHPVAAALLTAAQLPIAAPSANQFGRPSPTRAEHVAADLGNRVDMILDGGPTELGLESTILDLTQNPPVILRPGAIPREQLDHAPLAGPVADEHVTAPGMTLKHYAPHARVELFETETDLRARARQLPGAGILIPTAATLFAQLRDLDERGVPVILALLPPPTGLGLAVRDRLTRAAATGTLPPP